MSESRSMSPTRRRLPGLAGSAAIAGLGVPARVRAQGTLPSYLLYNEFKPVDLAAFQKFFDLFTEKGVFEKKLDVAPLIYKG